LEGPEVSGFVIFAFSGVKNQILTAKIAESAKSCGLDRFLEGPEVSGFVIFAFSGVKKSDFNRKDRRERKERRPEV
jgi:hypothetical protein